jgi:hypothetical protein
MINNNNFNNNNKLSKIAHSLNSLLGYTLPGRAIRFAKLGRNIGNYITGSRKQRIRRNKRNNGIEINKAIGGTKQVFNNSRIQTQTIEMYNDIILPDPDYVYLFRNLNTKDFDISTTLNENPEFLNLRQRCLQYKVIKISISFNYNRVPGNNDKFSKMIVTPETDLVLPVENPKINRNSMVWDMTTNGTKNYNFWINNRNTEKINQEWQIGSSQWSGICKIHLSSQGDNYIHPIPNQSSMFILGEMKISVLIRYVQNDSNENEANRITTSEILKYCKNEKEKEILEKKKVEQIQQLQKEINEKQTKVNQMTEQVIAKKDYTGNKNSSQ